MPTPPGPPRHNTAFDGPFEHDLVLLVEGVEPFFFLTAFIELNGLPPLDLRNLGGNQEARDTPRLKALRNRTDFGRVRSLGYIRDAEAGGAATALQAMQHVLNSAGLAAPAAFNVRTPGNPGVTAFAFPDCHGTGAIEDLCLAVIDPADPLLHCADEAIQCAGASGNLPKRRLHGYLDFKDVPRHELGTALKTGAIDPKHAGFDGLREYLKSLGSAP